MPQQSLLADQPPMTALRIEVKSYPHTKAVDEVIVTVQGSIGAGQLKTRALEVFQGAEQDYLDTYVQEALRWYMYGETWRQVAKKLAIVRKQARRHGMESGWSE